jgi:hypothetical protein
MPTIDHGLRPHPSGRPADASADIYRSRTPATLTRQRVPRTVHVRRPHRSGSTPRRFRLHPYTRHVATADPSRPFRSAVRDPRARVRRALRPRSVRHRTLQPALTDLLCSRRAPDRRFFACGGCRNDFPLTDRAPAPTCRRLAPTFPECGNNPSSIHSKAGADSSFANRQPAPLKTRRKA